MEALAAAAAEHAAATTDGAAKIDDVEKRVQEALECPCVADLKNSSCGAPFVSAFGCYIRSTAEAKGSDCVAHFVAMQDCITKHEAEFRAFGEELEVNEKAFIAEREAQQRGANAGAK